MRKIFKFNGMNVFEDAKEIARGKFYVFIQEKFEVEMMHGGNDWRF